MVDNILRKVKYSLGYPIVDVELKDEHIVQIIQDSMKELNNFSSDVVTQTVSVQGRVIDLTSITDLYEVLEVIESSSLKGVANYGQALMGMEGGYSITQTSGSIRPIQRAMIIRSQEKLISTLDPEVCWDRVGNELYLSKDMTSCTLNYIKKWVNEVDLDNYWESIIIRHASNNVKILIGRARRKYKSSKSLHEIDDTMLDEGTNDQIELMKELREKQLILPVIAG